MIRGIWSITKQININEVEDFWQKIFKLYEESHSLLSSKIIGRYKTLKVIKYPPRRAKDLADRHKMREAHSKPLKL